VINTSPGLPCKDKVYRPTGFPVGFTSSRKVPFLIAHQTTDIAELQIVVATGVLAIMKLTAESLFQSRAD